MRVARAYSSLESSDERVLAESDLVLLIERGGLANDHIARSLDTAVPSDAVELIRALPLLNCLRNSRAGPAASLVLLIALRRHHSPRPANTRQTQPKIFREGAGRVKDRAPAAVQITAEQLLREGADFQEKAAPKPKQRIEDFEELHEYRATKRQEFEEIQAWVKYANWEASQNEFPRSRFVFERALDVEPASIRLWLAYTEMELKARNIAHARNLFDRAVTLLPRIDQIWYKYVFLEKLLGIVAGARQVFERWMAWEPDEKAWRAYIKMEVRYSEFDRASKIYERMINCHPEPKNFVKWAKFEKERGNVDRAREIYQMGFEFYGQDEEGIDKSQSLSSAFAKMEVRHREYDRARVIYKFALDCLPRSRSTQLYAACSSFETQYGTASAIELALLPSE
ncbi:NineTeen Complex (NTC) component [Rhodotorula toruloides]